MAGTSVPRKDTGTQGSSDTASDVYRRKLQRILRSRDNRTTGLSGGVGSVEPRMSESMKQAALSPKLVNPTPAVEDEGPLFQCTECDMIVKESDPYCPFCGAIFADGPLAEESEPESVSEKQETEQSTIDRPVRREPMVRPEKFDLFGLLGQRDSSRDLLHKEALRGFTGSARLLEEIEHLISDIGALGTDTTRARRLIGGAWEAARDGNWNLASALARQTEEIVAPSIPTLVRSEIAKAREILTQAKGLGIEISSYVLMIKNAMQSLRSNDPDEALRVTKALMDSLREDSVSWR
ncbi:MAG: hypothetical protein JW880_02220 [Candidatus Thermoplasmatota archaeon]|nr:hypothetical protein [Candidatus Thermoplasmatota archaeon]